MEQPGEGGSEELVADFPDRLGFQTAVSGLIAAGYEPSDLSVLHSHGSLEVAGDIAGYHFDPTDSAAAGVGVELGWLAPVGIAGVVLAAAGPVGAAVAALAGAAAGIAALGPFFAELLESAQASAFADAIHAGHILLWVRLGPRDPALAEAILAEAGGREIRRVRRRAAAEA